MRERHRSLTRYPPDLKPVTRAGWLCREIIPRGRARGKTVLERVNGGQLQLAWVSVLPVQAAYDLV